MSQPPSLHSTFYSSHHAGKQPLVFIPSLCSYYLSIWWQIRPDAHIPEGVGSGTSSLNWGAHVLSCVISQHETSGMCWFTLIYCSLQDFSSDLIVDEDNTYKAYYYPTHSDEEDSAKDLSRQKRSKRSSSSNSFEELFEVPAKKNRTKCSSTVSRANKDGGVSYISTNFDDAPDATHLIKLEIYDLKKLRKIPAAQHWKHASERVKYYCKGLQNKHLEKTKEVIVTIAREISTSQDCRKYCFNYDEK